MLSVYLESFEKAIAFQVTNQDLSIKDFIKKNVSFHASNGWTITIANAPELDVRAKTIYLRGSDNSLDKRVDRTWDMNSNYSRDTVTSSVDKALNELVLAVASPTFLYSTATRIPTSGSVDSVNNKTSNKPLIKG
jgi:hypothetical protein